jgi:hypothetical protein
VLLSILWVSCCFLVILPHFNGGAAGGNTYWYRYAWAGASPGDAIKNLATHPWLLVAFIWTNPPRRGYIAMLLRTGGGLGIFAPALWVCAVPELVVNLYSSHPEQYSGFFQYNAMLVAFLFAAAVYGVAALYAARLRAQDLRRNSGPDMVGSGACTIFGSWSARSVVRRVHEFWQGALERVPISARWIGPLVIGWLIVTGFWNLRAADQRLVNFWNVGNGPVPYQAEVNELLAQIPLSASVAATDTLDPHLSDRYELYLLPDPQSYQAQYVAFDIAQAAAASQSPDQQIYQAMMASGKYTLVGDVYFRGGEVVVLRRTGPPLAPLPTTQR